MKEPVISVSSCSTYLCSTCDFLPQLGQGGLPKSKTLLLAYILLSSFWGFGLVSVDVVSMVHPRASLRRVQKSRCHTVRNLLECWGCVLWDDDFRRFGFLTWSSEVLSNFETKAGGQIQTQPLVMCQEQVAVSWQPWLLMFKSLMSDFFCNSLAMWVLLVFVLMCFHGCRLALWSKKQHTHTHMPHAMQTCFYLVCLDLFVSWEDVEVLV